jgi:hypothetical protein
MVASASAKLTFFVSYQPSQSVLKLHSSPFTDTQTNSSVSNNLDDFDSDTTFLSILRAMALLTYRPPVNYEEQQGDYAPERTARRMNADNIQLPLKILSEHSSRPQSKQLMH